MNFGARRLAGLPPWTSAAASAPRARSRAVASRAERAHPRRRRRHGHDAYEVRSERRRALESADDVEDVVEDEEKVDVFGVLREMASAWMRLGSPWSRRRQTSKTPLVSLASGVSHGWLRADQCRTGADPVFVTVEHAQLP